MSVVNRVVRGVTYAGIGRILTFINQILLTPLFLSAWGTQSYGEWLALIALLNYIALADIGIQNVALNRLTQAWAIQDFDLYHHIYHSACVMYMYLGIALYVFGVGIAWLVSYRHIFLEFTTNPPLVIFIVICLLVFEFSFSFIAGLLSGLFYTFQEYPRSVLFSNIRLFCLILLSGISLYFGGGWIVLASIRVVVSITIPLCAILDIRRRHPEIMHGYTQANRGDAWYLMKHGSWFIGITAANAVSIQGSVIVIQKLLGPTSVATFVIMRTLVNVAPQLLAMFRQVFRPEITVWEARGNFTPLQQTYHTLQKISLLTAGFCAIILYFETSQILTWWVRGKIVYQAPLVHTFLLLLLVQASRMTSQIFPIAMNHPKPAAMTLLLSTIFGVIIGSFIMIHIGIMGMVIGLLVGELCIGWYIPFWTMKKIHLERLKMFKQVWLPVSIIISVGWFGGWIIHRLPFSTILDFFSLPCGVFVIMALGTYCILEERERRFVSKWKKDIKGYLYKIAGLAILF